MLSKLYCENIQYWIEETWILYIISCLNQWPPIKHARQKCEINEAKQKLSSGNVIPFLNSNNWLMLQTNKLHTLRSMTSPLHPSSSPSMGSCCHTLHCFHMVPLTVHNELHAGTAGPCQVCCYACVSARVSRLHKHNLQSASAKNSSSHWLSYLLSVFMPTDLWPRVAFSFTLKSDRLIYRNNILL